MENLQLTSPKDFENFESSYISCNLLSSVANFEGFRESAYICSSGVLTIGFGHTSSVKFGDIISVSEAKEFLYQDLSGFYNSLKSIFPSFNCLPECYRNMLIDLAFNCGIKNFDKTSQTELYYYICNVISRFNSEKNVNFVLADNLFTTVLRYCHSNGRFLRGLLNRRFYYVKQCILWHEENGFLK